MANCAFNILAYFKVQEFMTTEYNANKTYKENFDSLLAFIAGSDSEIKMDTSLTSEQDDLTSIVSQLPNNTDQGFRDYLINKQYIPIPPKTQEPSVPPAFPGAGTGTNIRNIDNRTSGMTKSRMNLDAEYKNKVTLGENYFGGDTHSYQQFEDNFRKRLFQKILINFNDGTHIRNNDQLSKSLTGYRIEMLNNLVNFLKQEGIDSDHNNVVDKAKAYFKEQLNTSTVSGWTVLADSERKENKVPKFSAYCDFVTLTNGFDNLLVSYNLGLLQVNQSFMNKFDYSGIKYTINNSTKFKFAFGNDNFSLLDETSSLISTLVSVTNVVKFTPERGAYIDEGEFLNINSLNSTVSRLKQLIAGESTINQLGVRMDPFVRFKEMIERILTNPVVSRNFSEEDLNNLRTIYNYYYNNGNFLSDSMSKQILPGIHSLAEIYVNELVELGVESSENDLYINITRYFDESVNKMYTAEEYDRDNESFIKKSLTEFTSDRHYAINENQLNGKINGSFKDTAERFAHHVNLTSEPTNLDQNGNVTDKSLSAMSYKLGELQFSFTKDPQYNFDYNTLISILKGEVSADNVSMKVYEALKDADKILGWGLLEDNARLLSLILKNSSAESTNTILNIAGAVVALATIRNDAFKEVTSNKSSNITDSLINLLNGKYNNFSKYYNTKLRNLGIVPQGEGSGEKIKKFIGELSNAQSILSGESVKAVVKSLGGKSFPTTGLLSPIHDDKTNFAEIQQLIDEQIKNAYQNMMDPDDELDIRDVLKRTPIAQNLFGQYSEDIGLTNFKMIVGEELRTEVRNGDDIKEVSKMTTPELFTMAVLNDFYDSLLNPKTKGIVSLQPVTFADKIGQMLKKFKIDQDLMYNGTTYNMTKMNMSKMSELHYLSVGQQYMSLQKRIVHDYANLFKGTFKTSDDFKNMIKTKWIEANAKWMHKADAYINGEINPYYDSSEARSQEDELDSILKQAEHVYGNEDATYADYKEIIPLFNENDLVSYGRNAGIEVVHEVHYAGRKKRTSINNVLEIEFKNYANTSNHKKRMDVERKKMLRNMLKTGVVFDLFKSDEVTIKPQFIKIEEFIKASIDPNFRINNWVNEAGEMVFFKVKKGDQFKNGEIEDLIEVDENNVPTKDNIRNSNFDVVTNPILEYFFWSSNILSSNYNLATAGGIHAHELKYLDRKDNPNIKDDAYNQQLFEEAVISARTTASDKRNVFEQATIHPYLQNLLNGMPQKVKNAIINDQDFDLFNALAEREGMKVYDGSAFMPAIAMIFGDNSFGDLATKSFTHKLIHHRYDGNYLVAELEKYAVFGLTNELARKSVANAVDITNIIRKMTDLEVSDEYGNPLLNFNILDPAYTLKNPMDIVKYKEALMKGEDVSDFETIYDKVSVKGQTYYQFNILSEPPAYKLQNENAIRTLEGFRPVGTDANGHINYEIIEKITPQRGKARYETKNQTIKSVFDIWNLFGGKNSLSVDPQGKFEFGKTKYSYSEASNYNAATILTNYKQLVDPNGPIDSASNYKQPLKHSMIYQLNNTSGIKNGAKNINPVERWKNQDAFDYYITNTLHWGIQGNFDHGFDEHHVAQVSEMSQVISAAEANGNYHHVAKQLYRNIAQVVQLSMAKYNNALNGLPTEVYEILTKDMMKALLSKDELGFAQIYLNRVSESLNQLKKKNPNYDVDSLKQTVLTAFSDNNMYRAMISMIAGSVNRTAIKRKYSGIASVIKPGHDIYMVHDVDGKIVDAEEYTGTIIKTRLTNKRNVTTHDRISATSEMMEGDISIKNIISVDFSNDSAYYKYKNNPDSFLANIEFTNSKNTKRTVLGQTVTVTEDFGNGVTLTRIYTTPVAVDPNILTMTGSKNYEVDKLSGYARNIANRRLTIKNGDSEFDRYDMDSVRAKFALETLSKTFKNLQEATEKYNEVKDSASKSLYDKDTAKNDYEKAVKAFDDFKQSDMFRSLELYSPDIATVLDNTLNNVKGERFNGRFKADLNLNLIKAIENDHLLLEKKQMKVPLSNGGDGTTVMDVEIDSKPAECLLSNINRFKYGIPKGFKLSQVTQDYLGKKLESKYKISNNIVGDFIVRSMDGDSEMAFFNKKAFDNYRGIVTDSDLSIVEFEEEDGEIVKYYVDQQSGTKLFPVNEEAYSVKKIKGVDTIIYNDVESINTILSDPNFKYGIFNYNVNKGNMRAMLEYAYNYDSDNDLMIKLLESNDRDTLVNGYTNNINNIIRKKSKELYISWRKQLQVIAARIPAQSLQSFMAMEVVGFVDDDINAVVLPVAKNWLDGSDFDIDKTYMLGFSINKSGYLYTLNSYFDYDHVEAAYLNMSIPTGKRIKGSINAETLTDFTGYVSGNDVLTKANIYLTDRDLYASSEENYKAFLEVVSVANEHDALVIPMGVEIGNDVINNLIKNINRYNKQVPDPETMMEATKNSVAQSLITISSAVGNLMSSERPISMDQTRAASNKTTKAQDSREISREDPMGIYMQIIQQNAGKAVVGISAVGEKVFFAYSYYVNEKIKNLEIELQKRIDNGEDPAIIEQFAFNAIKAMSSKTMIRKNDGTLMFPNLIANANMKTSPLVQQAYESFRNKLIKQYEDAGENVEIFDVNTMDDASLVISEVLSAATDNAKELILDKINAGPELAGVYMYMIMQGVKFNDIADIMISDVVNKVVAKSKQNWYTESQKNNSIDTAINYYMEGVNFYNYLTYGANESLKTEIKNYIKANKLKYEVDEFLPNATTKELQDFKQYLIDNGVTLVDQERMSAEDAMDFENSNMDEESGGGRPYSKRYKLRTFKYINECIKRSKDMGKDKSKFIEELRNFVELKDASEELTIFGGRLGINQGIPTKEYDSYNFDFKLNNFLFKRFKNLGNSSPEISDRVNVLTKLVSTGVLSDTDVNLESGEFTSDAAIRKIANIRKIYKMNPVQQKAIGELYNEVKFSMNILDAELNLNHFKSMIDASYTVQDFLKNGSVRYELTQDLLSTLSDQLAINGDGFAHKFKEDEIKKTSDFLVTKMINEFFNQNETTFNISEGTVYIGKEGSTFNYKESAKDMKLDLSTPEGKASFKIYFENVVIPSLRYNENLQNNKFVSMLTSDTKSNSINGKKYNYVKLDFNMSSITEGNKKNPNSTAEMVFNQIKMGFEELSTMSIDGNRIWDMFGIYNILINKNSFGSNTFTKLFQSTSFKNEENAPFYQFMNFEGLQDLSKGLINTESLQNEVLLRISPTLERTPKQPIKYYKTRSNGETTLYELKDSKSEKPEFFVKTLPNADNELYSYLIDDFIDSSEMTVVENVNFSQTSPADIRTRIADAITNGKIIELINC